MLPPLRSLHSLSLLPKLHSWFSLLPELQHEHPGPTNSNPNSGQLRDFSRTQIYIVPSIKHTSDKQDKSITSQWELELYPQVDSMGSDLAGHNSPFLSLSSCDIHSNLYSFNII